MSIFETAFFTFEINEGLVSVLKNISKLLIYPSILSEVGNLLVSKK